MSRNNRIVKTSATLIRYFVGFSLLAVAAFYLAYSVFNNLFIEYVLEGTQQYIAKQSADGEYPAVDREKIHQVGGWVVVLDAYGTVIEGSSAVSIKELSALDISRLANSEYEYNDEVYFASIAPFVQDGDNRIVVAALPADKASVAFTVVNLSSPSSFSFVAVFVITTGIFLTLYLLIAFIMSRRLNKRIVLPIQAITQALGTLKSEEYNVSIDFEAKNEFVFIKNAFDAMIQRLSDAEHQRKEQQKEKMKMLSDIGHDLRTPITIMNGLLQALMSGRISDETIRNEYIETIYRNTRVLSELVELQLDYTLWERKEYEIVMKRQNLSECVRDVVIANYALCDEGGIELEVDIPDADIFFDMDAGQLRRAFSNLLVNAIFHNTNVPNLKIGVFVQQSQEEGIQVVVADTGNRLPDDVRASLAANLPLNGRASSDYGHGLGLSITQRIVGLHSGTIRLEENWETFAKAFIVTFSPDQQPHI